MVLRSYQFVAEWAILIFHLLQRKPLLQMCGNLKVIYCRSFKPEECCFKLCSQKVWMEANQCAHPSTVYSTSVSLLETFHLSQFLVG